MTRLSQAGFTLSLADGTRWLIRAEDPETARVVEALGAAMQLQPGAGGRDLLVTVGQATAPPANLCGPGPALCILPPPTNDDMLTIGMSQLALAIAREAQSRGGVLLHGALAEFRDPKGPERSSNLGHGILLAGPGTVGKTTASRRLPPPSRSLCDDTALVVRDAAGQFCAHPWPTWSRFFSYSDEPPLGGSWDVQRATPLHAVFFLSQSPDDRAEPLHATAATALLMETVQHVSRLMTRRLPEAEVLALHQEQLAAVEALAQAIPAYRLHISLAGAFWEEIGRALHDLPASPLSTQYAVCSTQQAALESLLDDGALHVIYTGASMNPTLREPDLLEVVPCEDRPVRPGDVIYFQSPEYERPVLHRVVEVEPGGVRTRGDNTTSDDLYLLQPADIMGRVVAAQRGQRRRRIAGGRRGVLVRHGARLQRAGYGIGARLRSRIYRALANTDLFRRLLPSRLEPRVFVFQGRYRTFLKVMIGQHVVGQYDTRLERWEIRRPFHLFVDEAGLPIAVSMRARLAREQVPGAVGSREPGARTDRTDSPTR